MTSDLQNFATEADFCSKCGTLLPLPGFKRTVVCAICKHEVLASDFDGRTVHSEVTFHHTRKTNSKSKKGKEVPDGPLVERKCSKCGNENMTYATLQTRSADEGQTVFYTCPVCRFKEVENS